MNIDPQTVRLQLETILRSRYFATSPRSQRFLAYVVDRALSGSQEIIKEFALGVEVFDKGPEFDPRLDTVVRVQARRVRQRLQAYYKTVGSLDPIVIHLPEGTYVPVFRTRPASAAGGVEHVLRDKSVAILPFVCPRGDEPSESLAEIIADDLVAQLSAFGARVLGARATSPLLSRSRVPTVLGRRLGVDLLLTGSVTMNGDRLRVHAQLIDGEDGFTLCSRTLYRTREQVLSGADNLAARLADGLAESFRKREGTIAEQKGCALARSLDARARALWMDLTRTALNRAAHYFQLAMESCPEYRPAIVGACDTHLLSVFSGDAHVSTLEPARALAHKALEVESNAEAHASLGVIHAARWDLVSAAEELQAGMADPRCAKAVAAYAVFCLVPLKRFAKATDILQQALGANPNSPLVLLSLALVQYLKRSYSEAADSLEKLVHLDPGLCWGRFLLASAYHQLSLPAKALADLKDGVPYFDPGEAGSLCLARGYAAAGQEEEARRHLARFQRGAGAVHVHGFMKALVHLGLKEKDAALRSLRAAYDHRTPWLLLLDAYPDFDGMKSDPAFRAIVDLVRAGTTGLDDREPPERAADRFARE